MNDTRPDRHFLFPIIREYNHRNELLMGLKALTFVTFSRISAGNYATIPPGVCCTIFLRDVNFVKAQESFAKNRFIVVRDAVPPYLLHALAKALETSRNNGSYVLGKKESESG